MRSVAVIWSAPAERSGDGALDSSAALLRKRRRRFALPAHSKFSPAGFSHASFQKIKQALAQPPWLLPSQCKYSRNTELSSLRISLYTTQVLYVRRESGI